MKLEVGMYVRLDLGYIFKWENNNYESVYEEDSKLIYFNSSNEYDWESEINKYSYNIIDLIEVGDYVNGDKVIYTNDGYFEVGEENDNIGFTSDKFIKSIVTKQQFSAMEYKID